MALWVHPQSKANFSCPQLLSQTGVWVTWGWRKTLGNFGVLRKIFLRDVVKVV